MIAYGIATDGDTMSRSSLDDISIRHLRYALAVAEAGSVSEAAHTLRVAQPSLSQQIRKLEARINIKLFERTHEGIKVTTNGKNFLIHANTIIVNLERTIDELNNNYSPWRLGVSPGLNADIIATTEQIIAHNNNKYGLVLSSAYSADLLHLLRQGAIDFGLVRAPIDSPDIVYTNIATNELGVVVPTDHSLAKHQAISWEQISSMKLLWFPPGRSPSFAADILKHLAAKGWIPEREEGPDQHALFQRRLLTDHSLVALRPSYAIDTEPSLIWLPFTTDAPLEHIVLAAVQGTHAANIVEYATSKCRRVC